jgi:hypothetical protein
VPASAQGNKLVATIILEQYVARSRRLYRKEAHDFTLRGAVLMTTHRVVATRMLTSAHSPLRPVLDLGFARWEADKVWGQAGDGW